MLPITVFGREALSGAKAYWGWKAGREAGGFHAA